MTKGKSRFGFRIIRLTIIYAAITFAVWFCIIGYLNTTVVFADAAPAISAASSQEATEQAAQPGEPRLEGVPADAKNIAFSHDGKYVVYLHGLEAVVRETDGGGIVRTIPDAEHPVLMADRNILLYLLKQPGGYSLDTYDIDGNRITKQADFSVPPDSRVKAVDYSNQTNLVYVNFTQQKNGFQADRVYSVNIMKRVERVSASSVVDNMLLLGTTDGFCYNSTDGRLYAQDSLFGRQRNGKLLGRDAQDRVYVQPLQDGGTVYVFQDNQPMRTITLAQGSPAWYYTDQNSVYAVYSGSLVNLAEPAGKMDFEPGLQFLGLGGDTAFFRDTDGSIVWRKLTL